MRDNGTLSFWKKLGIICGAMIAAGTIVQAVGGFLWGYATQPIIAKIEMLQVTQTEDRIAGQRRDSLMVEKIASIGEALSERPGSMESRRAALEATEGPAELKRAQRPIRGR